MSVPSGRAFEILVVAALFALAFGFLDLPAARSTETSVLAGLETWFFESSGSSPGLVAAIAGWMTWKRLPALAASISGEANDFDSSRLARACLPLALCVGVTIWSALNEARDLLFISAALLLGTYGIYCAGARGLRLMGMPMLTLCIALPIPFPLQNELVWTLQNWSAAGTAQALDFVGVEFERSGAHLAYGEVLFLVIEGCSGLRSILTLTLVALVLRELMGERSLKGWIPILVAPPLAMFLNIIRIAAIVLGSSGDDPNLGTEHLGQGLVVLAVGSVLLFFLSDWIARPPRETATRLTTDRSALPLRPLAIVLLMLGLIRWTIAPWPLPVFEGQTPIHLDPEKTISRRNARVAVNRPTPIRFPDERESWKAEPAEIDFAFIGVTPRGSIERRLYRRDHEVDRPLDRLGDRAVNLLIATSSSTDPRTNPFSSKLILPGRRWQIEETEIARNFVLGQEISISRVSAPGEMALVFSWTLRNEGFWRETLRSVFALERGPFARSKPQIFLHLATRLGEGEDGYIHAKRILNRFVTDFHEAFRAL